MSWKSRLFIPPLNMKNLFIQRIKVPIPHHFLYGSPRELLHDSLDSYLRDINQSCFHVQQSELDIVNHDIHVPCSSGYSNFLPHSSEFFRPVTPTSPVFYNPLPSGLNSIPDPPNRMELPPTLEAFKYQTLSSPPLREDPCSVWFETHCAGCNASCSNAHTCPDCCRPVHVICGHSVDGIEGYGSPVYCNSCWLKKRQISLRPEKYLSVVNSDRLNYGETIAKKGPYF